MTPPTTPAREPTASSVPARRADPKEEGRDQDKRIALAMLPLLKFRRVAMARAIEALSDLQRTQEAGEIAEFFAMTLVPKPPSFPPSDVVESR